VLVASLAGSTSNLAIGISTEAEDTTISVAGLGAGGEGDADAAVTVLRRREGRTTGALSLSTKRLIN